MGRDWLYKASGGGDGGHRSKSRGGGGGKSTTSASGCMSAIICNLFDIQHHHHHRPSNNFISHDESSTLSTSFSLLQAGIQPPRNSLEDQSPEFKQLSHYIPPVGRIHEIETKRSTFTSDDDDTSTPVTCRTPNVVARLMGLDLLPEYSSPRPSSSSHSLPPTPSRLSATASSPDHNHRLSLHVDKENYNQHDDVTLHKKMVRRRRPEVPVKQQTSRIINRRVVGTDITNTMSTNSRIIKHRRRRDSNLDHVNFNPKPKVSPPAREKTPLLSNSPNSLRLFDINSNLNKPTTSHPSCLKEMKLSKTTRVTKCRSHDQTTSSSLKLSKDTKIIKRIAAASHEKELLSRKKSSRLPTDNYALNVKINRREKDVTSSSRKKVSFPNNLITSSSHNYYLKPTAACCFSADGDLRLWSTAVFEGEVESTVMDIESEIFKNLVDEIVAETMASAKSDSVTSHVLFT